MQHEAAAADAARWRFDERQHRDHRYGRIGRGAALMQNLAPRLGRARIGRRGYALRGGERREGEGDERGEREESFQHGRDIGVEAEAAQPRLILPVARSEEHTSELQSLMRISY